MKGSMIIGVALASALALATGEFAHADTPYEINVLISTTGPAAFLGKEEAQDLQFIEQLTNQSGGIKGRPLKFVMLDDESNPQTAVQLTNQIIAKNVPAFLGPVLTSPCNAVMPIVAKSGPVDYCLSPGIDPDPRSYVFSAGVSSNGLGAVMVRYFRLRNWKRIAIITSTDATGQSLDRAFKRAKELPENKDVTYVDWEHFNLTDITVAAQIQRIKAANPQVLIAWTSGTAFVTLLRGIRDAGLDIPVGGGNANMIYAQMAQYVAIAPKELYFDGFQALVEGAAGPGPIQEAQKPYFAAFKAAGVRPDAAHAVAWDGIAIVVDSLRHLGSGATTEQVHDYIENLHGWAGINGVYDFGDGTQRGISEDALVIDRWVPDKNEFVVVSKPAGYLK